MPTIHQQVETKHGFFVDEGIRDLIELLNDAGLATKFSCQGGTRKIGENQTARIKPYILFEKEYFEIYQIFGEELPTTYRSINPNTMKPRTNNCDDDFKGSIHPDANGKLVFYERNVESLDGPTHNKGALVVRFEDYLIDHFTKRAKRILENSKT